jgi:hypothetical protein
MVVVIGGFVALQAFSHATAEGAAGVVRLEYNRLDRFAAPTTLRVDVAPGAVRRGRVRLSLNYAYVNAVRIRRIFPSPERIEPGRDGPVFVFRDEDREPMTVVFQVEGVAYGQLDGAVAVAGQPSLAFRQYLLP